MQFYTGTLFNNAECLKDFISIVTMEIKTSIKIIACILKPSLFVAKL